MTTFHFSSAAVLVAALLTLDQCATAVNSRWVSSRKSKAFVSRQHHPLTDLMLLRGGSADDNSKAQETDYQDESSEVEEDVSSSEVEDDVEVEKNWEDEDWEEVVPVIVETSKMEIEEEEEETEGETTMMEEQIEVSMEEVQVPKTADVVNDAEQEEVETMFEEEILVQESSAMLVDEEVRYNAGTTDGELADDEGMDSISTVEEAAELAAVTAGGAVMAVTEEEEEAMGDAVVDAVDATEEPNVEDDVTISDEMKQILRKDLKYSKRDIKLMRPEIASMVVYNKLLRPIEGMPKNWYIEGAGPAGPLRQHAVKIAIAVAAVGGVAAIGLNGDSLDVSDLKDGLKQIPAALAAIPAALTSFGKKAKKEATEELCAVKETVKEKVDEATSDSSTFSDEEMKEMENELPHSIKPGEKPGLTGKEDKSALDKFLTKIESMIKGFFNIKI